jgi:hemolysin III
VMTDDLASAAAHAVGLALVLGCVVALWRRARAPLPRFSLRIFTAAWTILYLSSIAYHLAAGKGGLVEQVALTLDDGAIFVAIAGTYTPIALLALRPADGRLVLTALWCAALAGLTGAALAIAVGAVHWYQPGVLVAGTLSTFGPSLAYCRTLLRRLPRRSVLLLALSGALYAGGGGFYRDHSWEWHHTLWHVAIVGGSLLDVAAIAALLRAKRPDGRDIGFVW